MADVEDSQSLSGSDDENEYDGLHAICACGRKVFLSKELTSKKMADLKHNNRELAKKLENSEMIIAEQMKQLAAFTQRANYAVCTSSKVHEVMVRMSNMAGSLNDIVSLLSEVSSYAKKATGVEEMEQIEQTQTMTLRVPETGLDDVFNNVPLISARNTALLENKLDRMSAIREDSLCSDDPASMRKNEEKTSPGVPSTNGRKSSKSPDLVLDADDFFSPGKCRSTSNCSRRKSGLILGRVGNKTPPTSDAPVTGSETPKTPVLSSVLPKSFKSHIPKPLNPKAKEENNPPVVGTRVAEENVIVEGKKSSKKANQDGKQTRKRTLSKKSETEQVGPEKEILVSVGSDDGKVSDDASQKKARLSGRDDKSRGPRTSRGKLSQTNPRRNTFVVQKDSELKTWMSSEDLCLPADSLDLDSVEPSERRQTFTVRRGRPSSENPPSARKRMSKISSGHNSDASKSVEQLAMEEKADNGSEGSPTPKRKKSPIRSTIDEETETAVMRADAAQPLSHVHAAVLPLNGDSEPVSGNLVVEIVDPKDAVDAVKSDAEQTPSQELLNATVVNEMDMELTDVLHPMTGVYLVGALPPANGEDVNDASDKSRSTVISGVNDVGAEVPSDENSEKSDSRETLSHFKSSAINLLANGKFDASDIVQPQNKNDKTNVLLPAETEDTVLSKSSKTPVAVNKISVNGLPIIGKTDRSGKDGSSKSAGDEGSAVQAGEPSEKQVTNSGKVRGTITLVKNAPSSVSSSKTHSKKDVPPPGVNDPCCSKSLFQSPGRVTSGRMRIRKKNTKYKDFCGLFVADSDDSDSDFDPGSDIKKPKASRQSSQAKASTTKKRKSSIASIKLQSSKKKTAKRKLTSFGTSNREISESSSAKPQTGIDVYNASNISKSFLENCEEDLDSGSKKETTRTTKASLPAVKKSKRNREREVNADDDGEITILCVLPSSGQKPKKPVTKRLKKRSKDRTSNLEVNDRDNESNGEESEQPAQSKNSELELSASKSSHKVALSKIGSKRGKSKMSKAFALKPSKQKRASSSKQGLVNAEHETIPADVPDNVVSRDETKKSDMKLFVKVSDIVESVRRSCGGELHEKNLSVLPSEHGDILRIKDKLSENSVIEVPLSNLKDVSHNSQKSPDARSVRLDNQRDSDKENEGSISPEIAKQPKKVGNIDQMLPSNSENTEANRRRKPVSYKEPSINMKMRRP